MQTQAPFHFASPPIYLSLLDEPVTLCCEHCGEQDTISLAEAAQQGWDDFDDETDGVMTAACPDCAASDAWKTAYSGEARGELVGSRSVVDAQ